MISPSKLRVAASRVARSLRSSSSTERSFFRRKTPDWDENHSTSKERMKMTNGKSLRYLSIFSPRLLQHGPSMRTTGPLVWPPKPGVLPAHSEVVQISAIADVRTAVVTELQG